MNALSIQTCRANPSLDSLKSAAKENATDKDEKPTTKPGDAPIVSNTIKKNSVLVGFHDTEPRKDALLLDSVMSLPGASFERAINNLHLEDTSRSFTNLASLNSPLVPVVTDASKGNLCSVGTTGYASAFAFPVGNIGSVAEEVQGLGKEIGA